MGKNIEEKIKKQHERAVQLIKEIEERQQELAEIYAPESKSPKQIKPLPEGISLMQAIMAVFKENANTSLRVGDVMRDIERKYSATVERKTLQSTIQYLASDKKNLLERVGGDERGLWKLK